jgi:hypothetical protein
MPGLRSFIFILAVAGCLATPAVSPSQAATNSFPVAADAHTTVSKPSANYGTATSMKIDSDPLATGYLRFDLSGLSGSVTKATLRLWATNASDSGLGVRSVSGTTWREQIVTHDTRPAVSSTGLSVSGSHEARRWLSLDVTTAVTGNGSLSLALVGESSTQLMIGAREAGALRTPTLVVETAAEPPSTTPPALGAMRPYDNRSPWNTPIPSDVAVLAQSSRYVDAIVDNGLPLTSDPDQYAVPVYYFDDLTPRHSVNLSGYFSAYDDGDDSRVGFGYSPTVDGVPTPDDAVQSAGSDGQIVLWNPTTGVEWSFWRFRRNSDGTYAATNGTRYRTGPGNFGRFADGKAGRGAGTPYLAGLVRPWEIARGRIDHALAFAYRSASSELTYPASKSDGNGVIGTDAPEGTRLQLDPSLTEADFERLGLAPEAKTIARALQRYGMYVVDNSGSSKIYMEDRLTADWYSGITRDLTAKIPLSRFRAVAAPEPPACGHWRSVVICAAAATPATRGRTDAEPGPTVRSRRSARRAP